MDKVILLNKPRLVILIHQRHHCRNNLLLQHEPGIVSIGVIHLLSALRLKITRRNTSFISDFTNPRTHNLISRIQYQIPSSGEITRYPFSEPGTSFTTTGSRHQKKSYARAKEHIDSIANLAKHSLRIAASGFSSETVAE